jgi:hypothetical protein
MQGAAISPYYASVRLLKGFKYASILLVVIPIPVSATAKLTRTLPDANVSAVTDIFTCPLLVNLIALLMRLFNI